MRLLPTLYASILTVTRRHGASTLARLNARLFPHGQTVALPAGGRMWVPPDPHFFGYVAGVHEGHITRLLRDNVRPGDVCLDVGANLGYFSAMLAHLAAPGGKVVAFEPVPENFEILRKNAALAAERGEEFECVQAAVTSRADRPLQIVRRAESTLHEVAPADGPGVAAVALGNEFLAARGLEKVDWLKIDVEGHERDAVEGALPILSAGKVRRAIIEITPGEDAAWIGRSLRAAGARAESWVEGRWQPVEPDDLTYRTDVHFRWDQP